MHSAILRTGWEKVEFQPLGPIDKDCYACSCLHKAHTELAHCYYWPEHLYINLGNFGAIAEDGNKYTHPPAKPKVEGEPTFLQKMQESAQLLTLAKFRNPRCSHHVHPSTRMMTLNHA